MMTLREKLRIFKAKLKGTRLMLPAVYAWRLAKFMKRLPALTTDYVRGKYVFAKLVQEKKDDEIYLVLGGAIGDNVYALAYTGELHKKFPSKKIIALAAKKNESFLKTYDTIDELRLFAYTGRDHAWLMIKSHTIIDGLAKDVIVPLPCYYIPSSRQCEHSSHVEAVYIRPA